MASSKQLLPTAVALIFAAMIYAANADRVVSLSPFAELINDYDKGGKCVEIWDSIMIFLQADHSGSSQPPVDIKTKVAFQYTILKWNFCFHINVRLGITWMVTL